MTLVELPAGITSETSPDPRSARAVEGRLQIRLDGLDRMFHARWLLDRSVDSPEVDPTSRQRLFEPADVPIDLAITRVLIDPMGAIHLTFNDGRSLRTTHEQLSTWIGPDPEAPPVARPWPSLAALPTIGWDELPSGTFGRVRVCLGTVEWCS